jgi:hypothetical protein
MNKAANQRQATGHQRRTEWHTGTGSQPAPITKLGRGDRPKPQLIPAPSGRLIILTTLLAITLGSVTMVINVANNMTTGRVFFSLKLMQVVEMQLEIDKPASEEPDEERS